MSSAILEHRFWAQVNKQGPKSAKIGRCWVWTGSTNTTGYGQLWDGERLVVAHRWLWEQEHGPVPNKLELDHLCRRPVCVRPSHLEPVTHQENVLRGESFAAQNARKTRCLREHQLSGDNLYVRTDGSRRCQTCQRAARQRYRARHSEGGGRR